MDSRLDRGVVVKGVGGRVPGVWLPWCEELLAGLAQLLPGLEQLLPGLVKLLLTPLSLDKRLGVNVSWSGGDIPPRLENNLLFGVAEADFLFSK